MEEFRAGAIIGLSVFAVLLLWAKVGKPAVEHMMGQTQVP
jgi:hypothetical protein